MTPIYYLLDLKDDPDLIAEYKKWHGPNAVPVAVTQSLREAGIAELEIFLVGNRMMMVLVPGEGFDPEAKKVADAENPDVQAWEQLMWKFQQALPFARDGQKWMPMERIYALSQQA